MKPAGLRRSGARPANLEDLSVCVSGLASHWFVRDRLILISQEKDATSVFRFRSDDRGPLEESAEGEQARHADSEQRH
jgi:hypothetical protein